MVYRRRVEAKTSYFQWCRGETNGMVTERGRGFGALLLMEFDREFIRPALDRLPGGRAPRASARCFRSCAAFISIRYGEWIFGLVAGFLFRPNWTRAIRAASISAKEPRSISAPAFSPTTPRARLHVDTWIGKECNIGAHSIIMPGVRIGDNCVVAAASVVMKDVPSNCLVAGNPARIMEKGIQDRPIGHHRSHGPRRLRSGFVRIRRNGSRKSGFVKPTAG